MSSDIQARLIESTKSLREEFLSRVAIKTFEDVARDAGIYPTDAYNIVNEWRSTHRIISVRHRNAEWYPAFQFDAQGQPRPVIKEILEILHRDAELTDWDIALWFAGDTGWLDGKTPMECLDSHRDHVFRAATQEALRDVD